jgi:hypothetical protein
MPPPHSNPLDIAQRSWDMAKKDPGERTFRFLSIGMLLLTGVATAVHTVHMLYRDTFGSHRSRDDARPRPADLREHDADTRPESPRQAEPITERQWTRKAEQSGRTAEGEQGWAASCGSHRHVRER